MLPKIHKCLSAFPGRPVISSCGKPTEKVFEYLEYMPKQIIKDSWSYIKGPGEFLKNIKNIGKISEGAILVTADVIGFYPSISHRAGLEAFRKKLIERDSPKVPADIVQIVRISYKWQYFFLKKFFLNSAAGSNDKNLEILLAQNLHLLLMLASS